LHRLARHGLRRQAERDIAFARAKAPSPLRSAGAVQNRHAVDVAVNGYDSKIGVGVGRFGCNFGFWI
jgi:hypothetical protein